MTGPTVLGPLGVREDINGPRAGVLRWGAAGILAVAAASLGIRDVGLGGAVGALAVAGLVFGLAPRLLERAEVDPGEGLVRYCGRTRRLTRDRTALLVPSTGGAKLALLDDRGGIVLLPVLVIGARRYRCRDGEELAMLGRLVERSDPDGSRLLHAQAEHLTAGRSLHDSPLVARCATMGR